MLQLSHTDNFPMLYLVDQVRDAWYPTICCMLGHLCCTCMTSTQHHSVKHNPGEQISDSIPYLTRLQRLPVLIIAHQPKPWDLVVLVVCDHQVIGACGHDVIVVNPCAGIGS